MQETWVQSLCREVPLQKQTATHSSVLAWRIPWTEEPGGLWSMGSQRVRHDWATNTLVAGGELVFFLCFLEIKGWRGLLVARTTFLRAGCCWPQTPWQEQSWRDGPVVRFQLLGWDAPRLAHLKPFKVTLAVFFSEGFCCFWLKRGGCWSLR